MPSLPEGSRERPYRENPNEHLKEVHWGGGGFNVGVNLFVTSPDGNTTNAVFVQGSKSWTETKTISGPLTLYDNRAGAFGNPGTQTFVLGGQATVFGVGPAGVRYDAWIETSKDGGKTWARSYAAAGGFVVAIVYDKANKVFFAQVTADAGPVLRAGTGDYVWQVLRSVDGAAWSVVDTADGGPANNRYASPIMTAAADPIYQDAAGNNCPGGVYGYDKAKNIVMAPYPDIETFAYEARFGGSQVQIRKALGTSYIDIPGMDRVFSVAYSGGVWVAAGAGDTALIATSMDDGETWATTYSAGPSGSQARVGLGVTR
jgi:hypothetical protein